MPWAGTSLEDVRSELANVAGEHNWEQFHAPATLAAALHGEVLHLQQYLEAGGDGWGAEGHLAGVLAYTVRLADKLNVDLGLVMQQALGSGRGHSPASAQQQRRELPTSAPVAPPEVSPPPAETRREKERPRSLDTSLQKVQANGHGSPQPAGEIQAKRPGFKRTLSVVCDQVQLPKPSDLYSPSHFCHDLFSPVSDKKDFEIDYDANNKRPVLPTSLSKGKLQLQQEQQPPAPAAAPGPGQGDGVLSPRSLNNFFQFVDESELWNWNDRELRNLDLRFCAPLDGQIIPLVHGGDDILVTAHNVHEFLRLIRELRTDKQNFKAQPMR